MKIHVFVSKLGSLISFPFAPAVHRTYMVTQRYVFSNGSQSTGTALAINLLGTPGLTPKSRTHTLNNYILKLTVTSQPGLCRFGPDTRTENSNSLWPIKKKTVSILPKNIVSEKKDIGWTLLFYFLWFYFLPTVFIN